MVLLFIVVLIEKIIQKDIPRRTVYLVVKSVIELKAAWGLTIL